jgi:hypothetical protein
VVCARSGHAQLLLAFLSTLAPAPIGGDLLVAGLSEELGDQSPIRIAESIDELERHSLLHQVDDGRSGRRQVWRLHALVGAAVRDVLDAQHLKLLAARAAASLSTCLANPARPMSAGTRPSWPATIAASTGEPPFDGLAAGTRVVA